VGAIQIRKSDGKKRSKHGTHGMDLHKKKRKKKNKGCVTLWPCMSFTLNEGR
jgi:hypothetical protein